MSPRTSATDWPAGSSESLTELNPTACVGLFPKPGTAARTTTKPLVLSHTSLSDRFRQFTRRISVEHAKAIADTNGVIGIWPVGEYFPTIADYARHMADMARLIGADHVGVGTDLRGLTGASAIADYHELPQLAGGLRAAGLNETEVGNILGGNYARVFRASM